MKSLNLHAINDLRYEKVETPKRKIGEVLVKIKASGICGSDIQRVFDKGTYNFPTIIGHEFAGEIVEAEDEDRNLIGKKAAIFPLIPCFKCENCKKEQYAQCSNYNYFGSRCDGGMAEYISVPIFNLVLSQDNVSFEELAMTEPCAVARHSIMQSKIKEGETIAIFGAGPIGIMLAKWAEIFGASKIILTDIDEKKVQFAREQGFIALNSTNVDPVEEIKKMTCENGVDVAIEGAGLSITLSQAIQSAANFGRVVGMGNPIKDINLPQKVYWDIMRKQLSLFGTWNSGYSTTENDWKESIKMMENGKMNVNPLISHKFDMKDYKKAFKIMRERKEFANKVMFVVE